MPPAMLLVRWQPCVSPRGPPVLRENVRRDLQAHRLQARLVPNDSYDHGSQIDVRRFQSWNNTTFRNGSRPDGPNLIDLIAPNT